MRFCNEEHWATRSYWVAERDKMGGRGKGAGSGGWEVAIRAPWPQACGHIQVCLQLELFHQHDPLPAAIAGPDWLSVCSTLSGMYAEG